MSPTTTRIGKPGRPYSRVALIALLIVVPLLACLGLWAVMSGVFGSNSKMVTVNGVVTVPGTWPAGSVDCSGTGSHSAIAKDAKVLVRDVFDAPLGEGKLSAGVVAANGSECRFSWSAEVPTGAAVYIVTIGDNGTSGNVTFEVPEANLTDTVGYRVS